MGRVFTTALSILSALTVATAAHVPFAAAQDYSDPPAAARQAERVSPRELDALLAPIALYPDQLLAPILMAATYPHDVEAAAQWASRPMNAALRGDGIAFAVEPFPWDPSVKTLAQFPDVLRMLNDEWDWMVRVGNAFYLQESDVMDAVQRLRHQAYAMGTLRSTDLQRVRFEGGAVIIDMIDPGSVYIPAYDPVRVYGYWSYPDFPPYYFRRPVTVTRYVVVPALWGWSSWEWHNHRIRVDRPRYSYFHRSSPWRFNDNTWRHDPRRGREANFRRDDPRDDWRGNDRRVDNNWRDDNRRDDQRERRNNGDRPRFNGGGEGRPFQPRERQAYAGPQLTPPAPVAPIAPMPPQTAREDRGRGFRGDQDEGRRRFGGNRGGDDENRGNGRDRRNRD